ncbi:hypothetical protein J2Y91_003169 [Erwinia aphidicola]|nr:hypothetical protein [Erwinia aphidicola]
MIRSSETSSLKGLLDHIISYFWGMEVRFHFFTSHLTPSASSALTQSDTPWL